MKKQELVASVAEIAGLSKKDAESAIEATFESITNSLKKGEEVRLINFGTFSIVSKAATQGRNPRTGEPISIPATRVAKFKAGSGLKDAVSK